MTEEDTTVPQGDAAEILRHARAAREDIAALAGAVAGAGKRLLRSAQVERRLREEPVRTLAIAFGTGYVAGGGFFTPTTRRLLRIAMRLWLLPAIRRELTHQQEYH